MKKIDMISKESMNFENNPKQKQKVRLEIEGDKIDIDLFLPVDTTEPVGCIIMSNGFGGTKLGSPLCYMTSETLVSVKENHDSIFPQKSN